MEKRVLLGQFSDQAQAQATLTALTDLGRAIRRPVKAEIVTAYQVIARVNNPVRAQKDLGLADKSSFRCQHCSRTFATVQARSMHNVRTHSKSWGTGGNGKKKK